jgi:AraC family transcriptional activator of tynA and feaB
MNLCNDLVGSFEQWLKLLRSVCGRYSGRRGEQSSFVGWIRPFSLNGLRGTDIGCNASVVERTYLDAKRDVEHFTIGQQIVGTADVTLDDRVVRTEPGDFLLIDGSRPLRYRPVSGTCNLVSFRLPRATCVARLGFEPEPELLRRSDTLTARLLCRFFQSVRYDGDFREDEPEVDIILYDLVRALFGPAKCSTGSPHNDRLFERVCRIIKGNFTDPDIGPAELAAEAGISLRYLQKLFTHRGTTCSQYIQSLRLGNAVTLLARRAEIRGNQSIAEIAWASGYRDASYFHRLFRRRFGHSPGASHSQNGKSSLEAMQLRHIVEP